MTIKFKTREQWLEKSAEFMSEKIFAPKGYKVPRFRVSIGFTGARNAAKTLGACWDPKASDDNVAQIYIVPTQDDPVEIQAVLIHELIHAVLGIKAGHGKLFKRCADAIGLEGPMRATNAGPELTKTLEAFAKRLGEFPHAKLNPRLSGKKKQTTRMIKAWCPESDYTVRLSRSWIVAWGPPICPCCKATMTNDPIESEDENDND